MVQQRARQILGVSSTATKAEIRRAFRRLAARIHPDVNPAADAAQQFRRALRAYRELMADRRPGAPRRRAEPSAPFRCPSCNDGFTQNASCPRCHVPLHRMAQGPLPASAASEAVDAMIAELETPKREPLFAIAPEARVPLMAFLLGIFAIGQARLGLIPLATMSFAFVLVAAGVEILKRREPAWQRDA